MKVSERATQIWSVLALAARNRQILTYTMLEQLTGLARVGLGQSLEPIQSYCLLRQLPPLTILVVQEATGIPGAGFSAASPEEYARRQLEVFAHDWLAQGAPSPEDLASAVEARPSRGPSSPAGAAG